MSTLLPTQNHNREFDLIDNLIATLRARLNEPVNVFLPIYTISNPQNTNDDDDIPDLISENDIPDLISDSDEDDPNSIQPFFHFQPVSQFNFDEYFDNGNELRDYSDIIREMNTCVREALKN